jgi:hypothetical protein
MHELDAVVNDLEWRRLRRRVAMNPAKARLFNCTTVVVIAFLRIIRPAVAR